MLVRTYGGGGISPLWDTGRVDAVALPGGTTYPAGQLLAQVAGTGTAVNDVQTITITGTPTGGSFLLFYAGILVGTVAYNATAAAVKTLLEAFFGVGNVTTSGGPFPGTAVVITFQGEAAGRFQQLMTTVDSFTGGTTPSSANVHTTSGKPAGGFYTKYIDGTADPAKRVLKYPCYTNFLGEVTFGDADNTAGEAPLNKAAPAYFQGHFRVSDLVGLDAAGLADLGKLTHGNVITDANAIICVVGAG